MNEGYIENTPAADGVAGLCTLSAAQFALGKVIRLGVHIIAICAVMPGLTGKRNYSHIHTAECLAFAGRLDRGRR